MQKVKSFIEFLLKIKEILFVVVTIIVATLNLWFSYQLAPYAKGMANLEGRISANEGAISGVQSDLKDIKDDVKTIKQDASKTREDVGYIRGLLEK